MTARLFRLTLMHQRIDAALCQAHACRRPDWLELTRLHGMKARVKSLIRKVSLRPALI